MTTQVLSIPVPSAAPPRLRERLCGSAAPHLVATAAAELLREQPGNPVVTVYRFEAPGQALVLLGASDGAARTTVVGSWLPIPSGPLGTAVRSGKAQRAANSYVDPDFVHSLPGEARSELAVPILGAAGCLGALHLEYPAPHQPAPHTQAAVEEVAAELVEALERPTPASRKLDGEALAELAHLLSHGDDHAVSVARVVESAHRLGEAAGAALLIRHESRQMLEVVAAAGSIPLTPGELFPIHGTTAGAVVRSGHPRVGTRRGTEVQILGPRDEEIGLDEALLAPVGSSGKTTGVLAIVNGSRRGEWPTATVELLQVLASMAGALEASRQMASLRQQISDGSLIAEVGRALTGTLGVDEVLALVVRAAEMLVSAKGVAFGLLGEGQGMIQLACTSGSLASSRGQAVPLHNSLMGWAAQMGEVVVTPCASDDPRGFPHEVRQGPAVVLPLESRGKTRGVLLVTRAEGAPEPSDADVDALKKLTAYAAIAIDNAQLYREQIELSEALRAQAGELERAYAELRESQDRLLVSEKMAALGRLTAGIAHEINSPLGGIMNCLQLATQYAGEYKSSIGDPEVSHDDHRGIANDLCEALAMAETATRKVGQFVRTIKGQTRMGDDETRVTFNAAAEIEGTLSILQHELRDRRVTLSTVTDREIELVGDPGKFALVVQNLVSNAIDAYEGADGEVAIRLERRGNRAVLEVQDRGSGIPEAIRGRIFDYLFTTKDVGQGTGLGLSIVHSIVTTHFQAEIELDSEVGAGSTFLITFPIQADGN